MIKEFRDFINRGNVVDLAVAVVIGGAFGAVVASFTDDILMPIIAAVIGEPDFSSLSFGLGDSTISYGSFITVLVNFLIIAFAVFLVVKGINSVQARFTADVEEEGGGPSEVELLTQIRDSLRNN